MELVTLTKEEFKKVADKSPQISFHQTEQWANLKKENGWKPYYLGLKSKKKILLGEMKGQKYTAPKK